MPFYAHRQGRRYYLLSAHLAAVALGAADRARSTAGGGSEELWFSALVAGLAHDFGKYTRFFQRYLRTGTGGPEKQHAFLSGLWAAWLGGQWGLPRERQLALFLAVTRHHRSLADPETDLVAPRELTGDWSALEGGTRVRLETAAKQVADLRERAGAVAGSLAVAWRWIQKGVAGRGLPVPGLPAAADWAALLGGFIDGWQEVYASLWRVRRTQKKRAFSPVTEAAATGGEGGSRAAGAPAGVEPVAFDLTPYFNLVHLFSTLIDADKIHAARVDEPARRLFAPDVLARYRRERFGAPAAGGLAALREGLYRTAVARAAAAGSDERLFTLTAPTGTGKTLAGLGAALALRFRSTAAFAGGVGSGPPRLIYALPFTSIVDQTYDVAAEVLRVGCGLPPGPVPANLLLKHHHLAEPGFRGEAGAEGAAAFRSLDEALLLVESWQSELVVTTFVQLFHTLVGRENRFLKKFHRLAGAIVVLDEVQNIPVELWPLVAETLRQAARHLDLRVILMTATRPEWFGPGEAVELGGAEAAVRERFLALDRVKLMAETRPSTVTEAVSHFLEQYQPQKSYLVVLNTIQSSLDFYWGLRQSWGAGDPPLFYLSTNILPVFRAERLARIRHLLEAGEKPVVVSTQVVEAGVDLDFDEVWRDLAPVDAVIQAAGRCNRHFTRPKGAVRLIHLVDAGAETGTARTLAAYVYGAIHTQVAREFFAGCGALTEADFCGAVADYFRAVRAAKSRAEGEEILQAMADLHFSPGKRAGGPAGVSDFALIKELPCYVDLFVCADARAIDVWKRYQETVAGERDLRRRRENFLALRPDFRRYLLSVPARLLVNRLADTARPAVIPPELVDEFYDQETGLRRTPDHQAWIY